MPAEPEWTPIGWLEQYQAEGVRCACGYLHLVYGYALERVRAEYRFERRLKTEAALHIKETLGIDVRPMQRAQLVLDREELLRNAARKYSDHSHIFPPA